MALVLVDNGESIVLSYLTGKTSATEALKYKLFATNITPAETDTAGTYTEASGGGYTDKTLTGASWSISGTSPTTASYAQQTWTFSGALTTNSTVYGYYAVRASTADLVLAEAFSSFTPSSSGDAILLTPQITAS